MFAGITAPAIVTHVHMAEDTSRLIGLPAGQAQKTALSQIGLAGELELVPFSSIELDLSVRADPCQARPVATSPGRVM